MRTLGDDQALHVVKFSVSVRLSAISSGRCVIQINKQINEKKRERVKGVGESGGERGRGSVDGGSTAHT